MGTFIDDRLLERASLAAKPCRFGRVKGLVGLRLEVEGITAAVGEGVRVWKDGSPLETEVVALGPKKLYCMPYGDIKGVRLGTPAQALGRSLSIRVGRELLGRVLDGLGRPLDDGPSLAHLQQVPLDTSAPHPLERTLVTEQLSLGVRAIDTLIPCGKGQRLGIFAGSGVGKSSLLSMIARGTDADVSVVALVGERGREVNEFLYHDLGDEGMSRSVVVVATSDEPALVRLRAAFTATRIAEWFRDQGAHVVLMMDSLTRFAMAQREVGLSAGEPPASRGYPPSVFSLMPKLLERAGSGSTGSITGLYTVLVEGDDMNEPVADASRAILDGHIVLQRSLATAGHFPSIDVLESISRLEPAICSNEQIAWAREIRRLLAAYRDAKDLIEIGAYNQGANDLTDRAIAMREPIEAFLCQGLYERATLDDSWQRLRALAESSKELSASRASSRAGHPAGGVLSLQEPSPTARSA
ncbi:MAG: FliI/YscN family ATPase [Actinobacteria bacterium]|nr:FliI/YscN family ATPase [Actinomycetota bacterium]MCL6094614.1 FliI/YscN family ATPase [Actinomycetota bacterium]